MKKLQRGNFDEEASMRKLSEQASMRKFQRGRFNEEDSTRKLQQGSFNKEVSSKNHQRKASAKKIFSERAFCIQRRNSPCRPAAKAEIFLNCSRRGALIYAENYLAVHWNFRFSEL